MLLDQVKNQIIPTIIADSEIIGDTNKVKFQNMKTTDGVELNKKYLMEYQIYPDGVNQHPKTVRFVRNGLDLFQGLMEGVQHIKSIQEDGFVLTQNKDVIEDLRRMSQMIVIVMSNFKIFGVSSQIRSKLRKSYPHEFVKVVCKYLKGHCEESEKCFVEIMINSYMYFSIPKSSQDNSVTIKDIETVSDAYVEKQVNHVTTSNHHLLNNVFHGDLDKLKRDLCSVGVINKHTSFTDLSDCQESIVSVYNSTTVRH